MSEDLAEDRVIFRNVGNGSLVHLSGVRLHIWLVIFGNGALLINESLGESVTDAELLAAGQELNPEIRRGQGWSQNVNFD
jgi:hypothetical protein